MNTQAKSQHPTGLRFIWAIAGIITIAHATNALIELEDTPRLFSLSKPCQFKSVSNFTYSITVKSYLSPFEEAQIGPVEYVLTEDQIPIEIKRVEQLTKASLFFKGKAGKTYTIQARYPQIKNRDVLFNAEFQLKIRRWQRCLFIFFYNLMQWGGIISLGMGIGPFLTTLLRPRVNKVT